MIKLINNSIHIFKKTLIYFKLLRLWKNGWLWRPDDGMIPHENNRVVIEKYQTISEKNEKKKLLCRVILHRGKNSTNQIGSWEFEFMFIYLIHVLEVYL